MSKTEFLLEQFYQSTHVPVHMFSSTEVQPLYTFGYTKEENPLMIDSTLLLQLIRQSPIEKKPWIHYELEEVCYSIFRDEFDNIYILGPVSMFDLNPSVSGQYIKSHRIAPTFSMATIDIFSFCSATSLLYYLVTGNQIPSKELTHIQLATAPSSLSENRVLQAYVMSRVEQEKARADYTLELEKMQPIFYGDVDAVKESITPEIVRSSADWIGTLADIPLKQWEYTVVTSIAVACRTAISAGVPPATAYSLADTLYQKLSKCQDLSRILQLQSEVRLIFASCVRDFKNQSSHSSAVEKSKQYMQVHLNKAMTLDELADHVALHKSYLCRIFKEAEGITPMEYLLRQRIQAAKDMLRYTEHSITHIAQWLCFNSQSHFGAVFKKHTGLTPKQYRDEYDINI